jgi:hypothetical protein
MSEPISQATAARLYALVVGGGLVLLGIAGFMYESSFGTGDELAADEIAGTLAVNGWRNVVYLISGGLGLAIASRAPAPYALGAGAFYLVIAVWGWFAIDHGYGTLLDAIPLTGTDNWLHLLIGVAGIAAWLAGRVQEQPRPARARHPRRAPEA